MHGWWCSQQAETLLPACLQEEGPAVMMPTPLQQHKAWPYSVQLTDAWEQQNLHNCSAYLGARSAPWVLWALSHGLALPSQRSFIDHKAVANKEQGISNDLVSGIQQDEVPNKHSCVGHQSFLALPNDLYIILILCCIEFLKLQVLLVIIPRSCNRQPLVNTQCWALFCQKLISARTWHFKSYMLL